MNTLSAKRSFSATVREDKQGDCTAPALSIPVLQDSNASHTPLIDQFYQTLASTSKVTIVCGAGISTHAGIPDFRSTNGLLKQTFGDRQQLKGSELFESRTLHDGSKRMAYSKLMTQMRISGRTVDLPSCHILAAELYDAKRLLRCYTQNFDGLQTRDRNDMDEVVFELHGTNVYLKCNICGKRPTQPSSDFDRQLLSAGYALCPNCLANPARAAGNSRNLRHPNPGELLPDIVLNDQVTEPSKKGRTLNQLATQDAKCTLLLIIGTRLKPKGVCSLVKGLAAKVHHSGGRVVYIDWTPLAASLWAKYVDLHIQMDIEDWAKGCLKALRMVLNHQATKPKPWVAAKISKLAVEAHTGQPNYQAIAQPDPKKLEVETQTARQGGKRVRFLSETPFVSAKETSTELDPILFIVYHSQWATFDARVLAGAMERACASRGRGCHYHLIKTPGKEEEPIVPPEGWSSFYLVVVYVSSYTQFLHVEERECEREQEIMEALEDASGLDYLAEKSKWSLAVVMCPEDELLTEIGVNKIDSQVKK
ncbi:hypothetical protein FRC07_013621 [Ceratobasidium sp. 392]|nr:hypothetical protein FRC07_013621 [Ceratobasidium sp. 392]